MIYQIEDLNDKGFAFEAVGVQAARLRADFGDGYSAGARIGDVRGLKAWKIRISALPDMAEYLIEQETRARYLYNFWVRHLLEKDCAVFRMRDPFPRDPSLPYVFAEFTENELEYGVFSEAVFSTGFAIKEARLRYLDPNDYNPQQI
jgi:hypothetical protein